MSWVAARARRRLGVREGIGPGVSPLPADLDVRDALSERSDVLEGRRAEVDDAPGDAVGTTVVDYHSDRCAVVEVRHRDMGPEREREVRGEQARVGARVPGCLALLDPDHRAVAPLVRLCSGRCVPTVTVTPMARAPSWATLAAESSAGDAAARKTSADGATTAHTFGSTLGPDAVATASPLRIRSGALKLRVENDVRKTDARDIEVGMRLAPTTIARAVTLTRLTLMGTPAPFRHEA